MVKIVKIWFSEGILERYQVVHHNKIHDYNMLSTSQGSVFMRQTAQKTICGQKKTESHDPARAS